MSEPVEGGEARRVVERHRYHVSLSPGVGAEVQRYALAVLDDVLKDLPAPQAPQDGERKRVIQTEDGPLDLGEDFEAIQDLAECIADGFDMEPGDALGIAVDVASRYELGGPAPEPDEGLGVRYAAATGNFIVRLRDGENDPSSGEIIAEVPCGRHDAEKVLAMIVDALNDAARLTADEGPGGAEGYLVEIQHPNGKWTTQPASASLNAKVWRQRNDAEEEANAYREDGYPVRLVTLVRATHWTEDTADLVEAVLRESWPDADPDLVIGTADVVAARLRERGR